MPFFDKWFPFTNAALLATISLKAQMPVQAIPQEANADEWKAPFSALVSEISNKDNRSAGDYAAFSRETLKIGQAALQSGAPIPPEAIRDALQSVDLGEALNPFEIDWTTLRSEIEKLLEPPPESEQQQNQDEQKSEEGQDSQESEGGGEQPQEPNEGEGDRNQGQEGQPPTDDPSQGDQQDPESEGQRNQMNDPNPKKSNLGETESPQGPIELDRPQKPQGDMQKIGGTKPEEQKGRTAEQAISLQQLEKIKQQDDPGKFYMLLQQSDEDESGPKSPPKGKDW